jgi:MFS family permease
MSAETHLTDITHTIQLAVAPVFLLSAIGTILAVLSNRLARIVDRARLLEGRPMEEPELRARAVEELKLLSARARLVHIALTTGTVAALLVCLLIAVAFIGDLFHMDLGVLMAVLFVLGMAAIVVTLVSFLREIFLAIRTLTFGLPPEVKPQAKAS